MTERSTPKYKKFLFSLLGISNHCAPSDSAFEMADVLHHSPFSWVHELQTVSKITSYDTSHWIVSTLQQLEKRHFNEAFHSLLSVVLSIPTFLTWECFKEAVHLSALLNRGRRSRTLAEDIYSLNRVIIRLKVFIPDMELNGIAENGKTCDYSSNKYMIEILGALRYFAITYERFVYGEVDISELMKFQLNCSTIGKHLRIYHELCCLISFDLGETDVTRRSLERHHLECGMSSIRPKQQPTLPLRLYPLYLLIVLQSESFYSNVYAVSVAPNPLLDQLYEMATGLVKELSVTAHSSQAIVLIPEVWLFLSGVLIIMFLDGYYNDQDDHREDLTYMDGTKRDEVRKKIRLRPSFNEQSGTTPKTLLYGTNAKDQTRKVHFECIRFCLQKAIWLISNKGRWDCAVALMKVFSTLNIKLFDFVDPSDSKTSLSASSTQEKIHSQNWGTELFEHLFGLMPRNNRVSQLLARLYEMEETRSGSDQAFFALLCLIESEKSSIDIITKQSFEVTAHKVLVEAFGGTRDTTIGYLLSLLLFRQTQYDEAIQILDQIIPLRPIEIEFHYLKAINLLFWIHVHSNCEIRTTNQNNYDMKFKCLMELRHVRYLLRKLLIERKSQDKEEANQLSSLIVNRLNFINKFIDSFESNDWKYRLTLSQHQERQQRLYNKRIRHHTPALSNCDVNNYKDGCLDKSSALDDFVIVVPLLNTQENSTWSQFLHGASLDNSDSTSQNTPSSQSQLLIQNHILRYQQEAAETHHSFHFASSLSVTDSIQTPRPLGLFRVSETEQALSSHGREELIDDITSSRESNNDDSAERTTLQISSPTQSEALSSPLLDE